MTDLTDSFIAASKKTNFSDSLEFFRFFKKL